MKLNQIIPRSKNFADWYTSVVTAASLVKYSSIKGMTILQPNAWKLWQAIQKEIDQQFQALNIDNIQLPALIKYSDFTKEKEHVKGFAPEVFLVTHRGQTKLDEPYVLRPTSEILFCNYFKEILISYKDLPILNNQWCNVFRCEKNTKPFLRTSEFYWQELHTIHATKDEAINQAITLIDLYQKFVEDYLCIPVLKGEKTEGERFAGASNTYTIEALMQDGQALQCATSHFLDQNFTKTYDIKFQDQNNKYQYPYQTSAGISTRIIGAIIMSHADDHGLVLPFKIAPTQIAILGLYPNKHSKVKDFCQNLKLELEKSYKIKLDLSYESIGYKIANQEVLGTPIIIVIGPNDLKNNHVTLISRVNLEKVIINTNELLTKLPEIINQYQITLWNKAKKLLDNSIVEVDSIDELKQAVTDKKIALCPWSGSEQDEKFIKEKTGASTRCIQKFLDDSTSKKCFLTGKKAKAMVYFARAY